MNCYTEEELYWMTGGNTGTLPVRITPSKINVLGENEIFVFGSNIKGMHMGGAKDFRVSLTHSQQWKDSIVPKRL